MMSGVETDWAAPDVALLPSESAAPADEDAARHAPALGKGLLSVADQAVVSGTSFATSVAIGRCCSQADLGVYALAMTLVLFVRGVQGELVGSPYAVFSHRRKGPARAGYTGSILVHFLVLRDVGRERQHPGLALDRDFVFTPAGKRQDVREGYD